MIIKYDSLSRLETPGFVLCNPGSQYDNGVLTGVIGRIPCTSDEEIVYNFNSESQLNLRVYRAVSEDETAAAYMRSVYDGVQTRRLIFVESVGYFIITGVTEAVEGGVCCKDVQAESCESELKNKELPYIEDNTYQFDTLMTNIVSVLPKWSIGYIDASVSARYRTFEDVSTEQNILAFLLGDMQDAYECIFVFDIIHRKIDVYDQNSFVRQTSVHLTQDDVAKNIKIEESTDELYTALRVFGDGELGIAAINPLGTNVIYDFSHYIPWMSAGLQTKVAAWTELVASKEDVYYTKSGTYYEKLAAKSDRTSELNRLRIVLDMYQRCRENIVAQSSDEDVAEYDDVITGNGGDSVVLDAEIQSIQYQASEDGTKPPAGGTWSSEPVDVPTGQYLWSKITLNDGTVYYFASLNGVSQLTPEIEALLAHIDELIDETDGYISTCSGDIEALDEELHDILAELEAIHNAVAMTNFFTQSEYDELYDYIFEGKYTDEYVTTTDNMTYSERFAQMKILYDRAKEQIKKISQPHRKFSIDVENFLFAQKFQPVSEQLETGCLINVELPDGDVAALFLSTMTVNYADKSLSMVFGERFDRFDIKSLYNDVLGNITRTANTVNYLKSSVTPIKSQFDAMRQQLENSRTLTKDAALSSSGETVLIDDTGYTGRRVVDGEVDPHQVKLISKNLVFTDDGWKTAKVALGEIVIDPSEGDPYTVYGINAETIIGDLIVGHELHIKDSNGEDLFSVIDGKISQSVSAEIDDALQDAKESGEFDGKDGKGIATVEIKYGRSDSSSSIPGDKDWHPTIEGAGAQPGQYLWQRTVITYTDNTASTSYTYVKQGEQGEHGTDGTSVKVKHVQYQAGTSATITPTGTWSSSPVTVSPGQYLWTRTTFTDDSEAYSVARQGEKGDPGVQGERGERGLKGEDGKDGVSTYVHIKYASTGSPSDGQMTETPSAYIGVCIDNNQNDPTTAASYTWSKWQGTDGKDGAEGPKGDDGISTYVHFAYAISSDGSTGFSTTPFEGAIYIGVLTDTVLEDSEVYWKYTWSKIKGDTGQQGVSITGVTNHYLATSDSSGVTTETSGWSTSVQTVSATKKYLWNYETITYSSGDPTTTTPCIIGTYGDKGSQGDKGDTGNGIASIAEHYAVSSSNSTAPTTWSDTPGELTPENKYLWNYETITYTDSTSQDTEKRVIGVYGDTGDSYAGDITFYLVTDRSEGVTIYDDGWTREPKTVTESAPYLWTYRVVYKANSDGEITETYTGDCVCLNADIEIPFDNVSAEITHQWDYHGYDAPWAPGMGKNRIDPDATDTGNGYVAGRYLNAAGTLRTASSGAAHWHVTEYIPVEPDTAYTLSGLIKASNSTAPALCRYDTNKTYLSGMAYNHRDTVTFTTEPECAWVRLSLYDDDEQVQLEAGESATDYAPWANICPLTLRGGLTVTAARKNLLNPVSIASGSGSVNGVDWVKNEDGSITLSGTATADSSVVLVPTTLNMQDYLAGKSLVLNGCPAGGSSTSYRLIVAKNETVYYTDTGAGVAFSIDDTWNTISCYIRFNAGIVFNNLTFFPMIRMDTETDSYEPYLGVTNNITWQDEVGLIYAGTLDVTSGTLTVTQGGLVFDGTESWEKKVPSGGDPFFRLIVPGKIKLASGRYGCSHFPNKSITTGNTVVGYYAYTSGTRQDGYLLFRPLNPGGWTTAEWKEWLASQAAAGTPVSAFWLWAEPKVYQLTPQEVLLLIGSNTIWTDAGPITVRALADASKTQPVLTGVFGIDGVGVQDMVPEYILSFSDTKIVGAGPWTDISGETNRTLSISVNSETASQYYRCAVSGANDTLYTDYVRVEEKGGVLQIIQQPIDYRGIVNSPAIFCVVADGPVASYQWQYNSTGTWKNSTSAGATTNTVSIPITKTRTTYKYRCIITGTDGSTVTTDEVCMFIDEEEAALEILQQPSNCYGANGDTRSFTVITRGESASVGYAWQQCGDAEWSTEFPEVIDKTWLWIRSKIVYTNGDIDYTEPYCATRGFVPYDEYERVTERLSAGIENLSDKIVLYAEKSTVDQMGDTLSSYGKSIIVDADHGLILQGYKDNETCTVETVLSNDAWQLRMANENHDGNVLQQVDATNGATFSQLRIASLGNNGDASLRLGNLAIIINSDGSITGRKM